jgi:hypothetical protein
VPMMAGQAAIAVMIPKTISKIGEEGACRGDDESPWNQRDRAMAEDSSPLAVFRNELLKHRSPCESLWLPPTATKH